MSNGSFWEKFTEKFDFLQVLLQTLIKIVYNFLSCVLFVFGAVFGLFIDTRNMTETSKKRKRSKPVPTNQAVANRGIINANWQKLLSSNLIMTTKVEKPAQEAGKDHFTGTFRRARKKKAVHTDPSKSVENNLKSLNLEAEAELTTRTENNDSENNSPKGNKNIPKNPKSKEKRNSLTKFIAMDCEMVGIGFDGNDHMLARVSMVNKFGDCIYDKYVKAREEVKDYRTDVSGIRKEDMLNGEDFTTVQKEVAEILKGRVLVGHSLRNDLSVLFLSHPKKSIRDTSKYKPFRKITKGSTPSLKRLAKEILSIEIQHGEHSSVEDARAAMQLYCTVAKKWEATVGEKRGHTKITD